MLLHAFDEVLSLLLAPSLVLPFAFPAPSRCISCQNQNRNKILFNILEVCLVTNIVGQCTFDLLLTITSILGGAQVASQYYCASAPYDIQQLHESCRECALEGRNVPSSNCLKHDINLCKLTLGPCHLRILQVPPIPPWELWFCI